jgi:predicted nucleic acid-binding protein
MQRTYFADAWYFIALLEPRDGDHRNARRLARFVEHTRLLTHEAVLTEVLAYFAAEGPRARLLATEAVQTALIEMDVISVDRSLFRAALRLYERRPDKEYSLVDCTSMELMRARGVSHVLTHDHHFRQEGFTVLSDAP